VRDGVISITPTKASPRVGVKFTKDSIRRAVSRAVAKANKARAAEGEKPLPSWTPYQLRYTRTKEARDRYGRETARAVAGHSRATMTDHYAPENWAKAARFAANHG
jgi:integrase